MSKIVFSKREFDLLNSLIEYWQVHAIRCDTIANKGMATKQKEWDLERVAMLIKLRLLLVERLSNE